MEVYWYQILRLLKSFNLYNNILFWKKLPEVEGGRGGEQFIHSMINPQLPALPPTRTVSSIMEREIMRKVKEIIDFDWSIIKNINLFIYIHIYH